MMMTSGRTETAREMAASPCPAVSAALEDVAWNRVKAARLLRISYSALRKMVECGLARGGRALSQDGAPMGTRTTNSLPWPSPSL